MTKKKKAEAPAEEAPAEASAEGPLEVHVARRSVNTWWCSNCGTGNPTNTQSGVCSGCGGVAEL